MIYNISIRSIEIKKLHDLFKQVKILIILKNK